MSSHGSVFWEDSDMLKGRDTRYVLSWFSALGRVRDAERKGYNNYIISESTLPLNQVGLKSLKASYGQCYHLRNASITVL